MSSVNKAILLGNVGNDPEIRSTQDGRKIANFSLATSESWKDKRSGERMERTEWHRVVVFNEGIAGVVEQYVFKGSKLYVEGQIKTRKWEDREGVERYVTEVVIPAFGGALVLLGGKQGERREEPESEPVASQPASNDLDDEIPF